MPPKKIAVKCPYDACPMTPCAAEVKVSHGYTITLYGCAFCNFNRVLAFAFDAQENTRLVAQWRLDSTNGRYVLGKEHGRNPPDWLDLATAALPRHRQPKQQEQKEEGEPI